MISCACSASGKGEKKTLEVDVPWLLTGTYREPASFLLSVHKSRWWGRSVDGDGVVL